MCFQIPRRAIFHGPCHRIELSQNDAVDLPVYLKPQAPLDLRSWQLRLYCCLVQTHIAWHVARKQLFMPLNDQLNTSSFVGISMPLRISRETFRFASASDNPRSEMFVFVIPHFFAVTDFHFYL